MYISLAGAQACPGSGLKQPDWAGVWKPQGDVFMLKGAVCVLKGRRREEWTGGEQEGEHRGVRRFGASASTEHELLT